MRRLRSANLACCALGIGLLTSAANAAGGGEVNAAFPSGLDLGGRTPPSGTVVIRTVNGSNITLDPQGKGKVYISRGAGALDLRILRGGNVELPPSEQGPLTPIFSFTTGLRGHVAGQAIYPWAQFSVPSDTASVNQAISDLEIDHNFGGHGWSGARIGVLSNMVQTGAIADGGTIEGMQSSVTLRRSFGGENLYSGARGAATGFNPFLSFTGDYRNGIGGSGIEVDVSAGASTTFQAVAGVAVVHMSANASQGTVGDAAFEAADQGGASGGWLDGLEFGGRQGQWPMAPVDGTLIKSELGFNAGQHPSSAAYGDDYLLTNFRKSAFRSKGFSVLSDGAVEIGTGLLRSTSAGLTISATASQGHLVSLASGGIHWPTDGNSYYATDRYNGVYLLEIAAGRVTGVRMYRRPTVEGRPPANPVHLAPDPLAAAWGARGLAVNLRWTTATELRLNPTGNTVVGSGRELNTRASKGFFLVPTMDGSPQAKPGRRGEAAMVVDTRDSKLCFDWSASGWKCTALK